MPVSRFEAVVECAELAMSGRLVPVSLTCGWGRGVVSRVWSRCWALWGRRGPAWGREAQQIVSRRHLMILPVACALTVLATGVVTLTLGPAPAHADPGLPDVTVHTTTVPMPNLTAGTATNATATCPSGTTLVGGGSFLQRSSAASDTPGNGLKLNGTLPSDAAGNPAPANAATPASWAAVAGFGGQADAGDQVTAFADCATGGPTATTVVVSAPVGVTAEGNAPAKATATCPSGTRLLSGGALGVPPSEPSFKPIASYPSDATGSPASDGAVDPSSWTAYGSAGQPNTDQQVSAFAVCSTDATVSVEVARVDANGPQTGSAFTTTTAPCVAGDRLLGGGVLADQGVNVTPQQGVHLRGSYPSDASGTAVTDAASNPIAWTGVVQAGGQATPGTEARVFALCATSTSTPMTTPTPEVSPTPEATPTPQASPTPVVTPAPSLTPSPSPSPTSGVTATTTTLYVVQVPLPFGLGGVVVPIAVVSPRNAAGTVVFKDGSTSLGGPVAVTNGVAIGPSMRLPSSPHSMTTVFTPTDLTAFQSSTSNTMNFRFLAGFGKHSGREHR